LPRSPNPRAAKQPKRTGKAGAKTAPASDARAEARGREAAAGAEAAEEDEEGTSSTEDGDDATGEESVEGEAETEPEVESDADVAPGEGEIGDEPQPTALASWGSRGSGGAAASGDSSDDKASVARFDPLAAYLREVQRHPLLSAEETQTLAKDFVATQDAAKAARLVTANLRLVVKIAYEYRRAYKNILDLIQEGNIGLMQAVKRYDPYRGVKLSSYAAWWIRAYILRFVLNNWRLVKLGTTQAQRKLFFNLRKKRAELQAMGIDPTDAEVAKQLNVPESDVAEMEVRLQSSERSLDAPIGDGEGRATAKIDTMASSVEGPEALMAGSELQGLLKEKLATFRATLDGKEKDLAIFDQRLVADEPLTLQELGDRFGISRERVRQLEQRLTGRLREYLRDEMGDAVEVA
jgi:RNA polymerase sigma-32 factor